MLNALRQSAGSWVVKIFLGLLILSFAVWGIGDIFRFNPEAAVATVGDQDVPGTVFLNRFDREVRAMQANIGPQFDQEQARRLGFVDRVLQDLITEALYSQEVYELGLTTTDDDMRRRIQEDPAFRDTLGNFNRLAFEQRIRMMGETEQSFVAGLQRQMSRIQLVAAVASVPAPPNVMSEAIYRYQNEKRVLRILEVPHGEQTDVALPSEEDLRAYHDAHPEEFTAPEYREITFRTLQPEDLMAQVHVDEQTIRTSYDERVYEFTTVGTRTVEQIVVQDEGQAKQIRDRLNQGEDFYAVAQDAAGLDRETVALGQVTRDDLPAELSEPVFQTGAGEIGGPVSSAFGWHVFRVLTAKEGGVRSYEDAREDVLQDVKRERAIDAMYDMSNAIQDELAAGKTLEEAAESLGLTHGRLSAVDISGRNRDGQPADGVPELEGFLTAAFDAQVGLEPELRETSDGNYFVLRVDNVFPAAVRPLADVRDDVRERVVAERRAEAAREEADRIVEAVRGGDSLEDFASEDSDNLSTTEPLVRTSAMASAGFSDVLADEVYALPVGGVATGVSRIGGRQLVVAVEQIIPADSGSDVAVRSQITDVLAQSMAGDLSEMFREALRQRYDVAINDRVIDSLFDEANVRR